MSIKVESTGIDQGAGPVEPAANAKPEDTQSAPVAQAAEQKESEASDTPETEDEEGDETEADASDKGAEAKDSENDKPKKKSGSQRRKERAERAEAEVARLQRLVEDMALKRAGESKAEPHVESKPAPEGKPHPDNFETHTAYVEALADWTTDQKFKEREQKSHQEALKSDQAKVIETHKSRVRAFAEKNKDFDEMMENLDDVPKTPAFEASILESEHGPAILYELAKNPEEAARIAKLPPLAAARELGKIEAKVALNSSEDAKPEPKKITKAPKPIAPIGGKSGGAEKSIFDPDISQAEYERLRAKQRSA